MTTLLSDFLTNLSENTELYNEYVKDPAAVIEKASLTKEAQAALASGSPSEIRKEILLESGKNPKKANPATIIVTVYTYTHVVKPIVR